MPRVGSVCSVNRSVFGSNFVSTSWFIVLIQTMPFCPQPSRTASYAASAAVLLHLVRPGVHSCQPVGGVRATQIRSPFGSAARRRGALCPGGALFWLARTVRRRCRSTSVTSAIASGSRLTTVTLPVRLSIFRRRSSPGLVAHIVVPVDRIAIGSPASTIGATQSVRAGGPS